MISIHDNVKNFSRNVAHRYAKTRYEQQIEKQRETKNANGDIHKF